MTEIHDFDNTVVAVLDRKPSVADATDRLAAAGYRFEVLTGEQGREHLDPERKEGFLARLKQLFEAFGDQQRIVDDLDQALAEGKTVISVDVESEDHKDVVSILRDHGGEYMWKFGEWAFHRIGD